MKIEKGYLVCACGNKLMHLGEKYCLHGVTIRCHRCKRDNELNMTNINLDELKKLPREI